MPQQLPIRPGPVRAEHGTYRVVLWQQGCEREYLLHVPTYLTPAAPLVIALHGSGGTPERMAAMTGLIAIADREGWLLALPQGFDRNWNDGRPDSGSRAVNRDVDDVGFIGALTDDVAASLPLDPRRVYVTGFSSGAIMSTRLASELSGRIAAVGLVAGTAPLGFNARWGRPMPVIAFHGTEDRRVPYHGGHTRSVWPFRTHRRVVAVDDLRRLWATNNGCTGSHAETYLPHVSPSRSNRVARLDYPSCASGAEVVFYRIEGGGHTWPGSGQIISRRLIGRISREVDASELIWRFFADHCLP